MTETTNTQTTNQYPSATAPTQPPYAPTGAPLLLRRSHDGVIAGVARGLADYLDAPVALVRALFVLATFFGGAGVPVYLVLWLIVPTEDSSHGVLDQWLHRRR